RPDRSLLSAGAAAAARNVACGSRVSARPLARAVPAAVLARAGLNVHVPPDRVRLRDPPRTRPPAAGFHAGVLLPAAQSLLHAVPGAGLQDVPRDVLQRR